MGMLFVNWNFPISNNKLTLQVRSALLFVMDLSVFAMGCNVDLGFSHGPLSTCMVSKSRVNTNNEDGLDLVVRRCSPSLVKFVILTLRQIVAPKSSEEHMYILPIPCVRHLRN